MVEQFDNLPPNQAVIALNLDRELWLRFQTRCQEQGKTITEVLSSLIHQYLEENNPHNPQSLRDLEELIIQYLRGQIEFHFEQYFKTQIIDLIKHSINEYFQTDLEQPIHSVIESSSTEEAKTTGFEPVEAYLKTAKELGKILGVSAPYITTLNRIGELKQWGWEDSGQRRGKTILYRPINLPK
ncbi:MAG: plasmid partition protein ParG [Planktothrix sp.]|uniref:plasmid partition protein ParG n=1 Tax=Planktothrix sp. TaxID=3088171 RepID=UPI0038D493F2